MSKDDIKKELDKEFNSKGRPIPKYLLLMAGLEVPKEKKEKPKEGEEKKS